MKKFLKVCIIELEKWKTKKLADGDTRERGAFEPTRKEVAALGGRKWMSGTGK